MKPTTWTRRDVAIPAVLSDFAQRVQFGFLQTYLVKIPATSIPLCVAWLALVRRSIDVETMKNDAWQMFLLSLKINAILFVAMYIIYGRKQ